MLDEFGPTGWPL